MTISPIYLFIWTKMNFYWSLCVVLAYFHKKKLLTDHLCKSHEYAHQWADLVMA